MTRDSEWAGWAGAGLLYPGSTKGELERSFPSDTWYGQIPTKVAARDGLVSYEGMRRREGNGTTGLLQEFELLADAESRDRDIVRFAKRWGPLGVCPDCPLPIGHPESLQDRSWCRQPTRVGCRRRSPRLLAEDLVEPASAWRLYARRARSILRAAAAWHRDQSKEKVWSTWLELGKACEGSPMLETFHHFVTAHKDRACRARAEPTPMRGTLCSSTRHRRCEHCSMPICWTPQVHTLELGDVVDEWLEMANTRVRIYWPWEPPLLRIGGENGLLAELGIQLAVATTRGDNLAICTECGVAYSPTRKPRAGQRTFCKPCREAGAPQMHASRTYRSK